MRQRIHDAGLDEHVVLESAGTGNWHLGEPADRRARAVLEQHGYDGSAHRARQFGRDWFRRTDVVLAMDRDNFADLADLAPDDDSRAKIQMFRAYDPEALRGDDTDVPDPYLGDSSSFEHVLGMIETAADGIVDTVRQELGAPPTAESGERSRR